MSARERWCDAVRSHPLLVDAGVPVILCAAMCTMAATGHAGNGVTASPPVVGIAIVVYALTIVRNRYPTLAVIAAVAGSVISMAVASSDDVTIPAVLLTLFSYSLSHERGKTTIAALGVMIKLLFFTLVFRKTLHPLGESFAVVPWAGLAAAIGQAVRHKRAYLAEVVERARRAERTKEEEAQRRVDAERLRIARELHDVVGHHVALINVQAGAATYMLDKDPAQAGEALGHIRRASQAALEELRVTVGLLRQPGDREPVEPAPGLGRLDELIESFTHAGLPVRSEVTGDALPLPETVDLTAYRLVQESLTNTRKHAGTASALVRLAYKPGMLHLAVEDDGSARPARREDGHGIIGMRERVAAIGGWLAAGYRTEGGYRVEAMLPLPADHG
jgi:signal transduction histidine kinase